MTLKLVANNPEPPATGVQGHDWKCQGCGCTILQGSMAGVKVRKGELNLAADSCHTSGELRCAGCDQVAAMKVDGCWKVIK